MTSPATSRREFLKTAAFLGGSAAFFTLLPRIGDLETLHSWSGDTLNPLVRPENILYTVCQQCNTQCGIKVKMLDGLVAKIEGNPYSPWTLKPHVDYTTPLRDVAPLDGAICPKGQSGIQTLYDPYRLVKVLKRAGKRGENKWITIPFEQAIAEIVEGGYLFKHVEGEENRYVTGLRELWVMRDAKIASEMAGDIAKIWDKKMTVEEFKAKWRDHLHILIDPDHPDLGPKNNQLVFLWGRLKGGRSHMISRFADSFGTVNRHGHTTVCQGSLYFACKAMSEQYVVDQATGKGKWAGGQKFYWQADLEKSRFVIFVGASPFEANYGPPHRTASITEGLVEGRLKIAVIDPRFSKTASKAWRWIPIKPGTEAAFAMGMIRWIIENDRYDKVFLSNANKAAAFGTGESCWTNASWLVKIVDGQPTKFLRAHEIGLEGDMFVVMTENGPVAFNPYDDKNPVVGELLFEGEVGGFMVKTAMKVLYDMAASNTVEKWAEICGVEPQDIIDLAFEFTSHGKRAAADVHRGVSQHTNGFYNVTAWMTLNLLIGNFDWAGGMVKATTYNVDGTKKGQPFNITENPGKLTAFGVSIVRHEVTYEKTTLFNGYPAKRQWYPLSSDLYQEVVPSIGDAYPYPVKALILYMGTPVYALPAGHTNIPILMDVEKLPLFIAIDILVGTTSMYADYIFPDLTYLERWEFAGSHPSVVPKVMPIRQPVASPMVESVKVFGEEMPISLETFLLAIAEKLGLPGFGENAFGDGRHLKRVEDLYLRMVANVAMDDQPVPDADDEELMLFSLSRRHLPVTVFDEARWRSVVGDELWRKVVYVLNRGGRFQDYDEAYAGGGLVKNRYGNLINMYQEKTASSINAFTGKPYPGIAHYVSAPRDSLGRELHDEEEGYILNLITYRTIIHTKSRTVTNYWLLAMEPENHILINRADAERLGLRAGDVVRVVSATNPEGVWELGNGLRKPIEGTVKIVEGIRPGVVAFSLGYGHWATGAAEIIVDGVLVRGDPRRARGVHANAAMRIDPVTGNTCLTDYPGGSAVFYDTRVKLIRV